MSCLTPTIRYRLHDGTVITNPNQDSNLNPINHQFYTPCGQCVECRLSRTRMWATRCMHEAMSWKKSCFITLTYKTPPPLNSLSPEDTRNFIRRLRDHLKLPFKYLLAGEYGDENARPHYHALIFGTDFGLSSHSLRDNILKDTEARSCSELDSIWGLGHTSVGELTWDSAAYTASYCLKKINGKKAKEHYGDRYPEFARFSKDPIGKSYALQYHQEIINNGSVISDKIEQPIPRYYMRLYEKQKFDIERLKQRREDFSSTHSLYKSYARACAIDSKFNGKTTYADKFRQNYLKQELIFGNIADK